jgi:hypothetical protein
MGRQFSLPPPLTGSPGGVPPFIPEGSFSPGGVPFPPGVDVPSSPPPAFFPQFQAPLTCGKSCTSSVITDLIYYGSLVIAWG